MDLAEPFVRENWCVVGSHTLYRMTLLECALSPPQVALGTREAVVVHQEVEIKDSEEDAERD